MKGKRKPIPEKIKKRLVEKNLGVCCVCKERGLGINFHHINGDPTDNREDNIAILCVKEHDQHHRPTRYDQTKHLELGKIKIKEYKQEWEKVVAECKTDNPKIIAVLTAYGDIDNIHSVRLVVQNIDQKIIFQRDYHLLTGSPMQWIDDILNEVKWLGENIKLIVIDEPVSIDYCSCGTGALSTTLDRNAAIHLTANDWAQKSIGSIYINPKNTSIALAIFYSDELIFSCNLHKCGEFLHFISDNYEERVPIRRNGVRAQAVEIMNKVIDSWEPGNILIGTGNPDNPTIINDFNLPKSWGKN